MFKIVIVGLLSAFSALCFGVQSPQSSKSAREMAAESRAFCGLNCLYVYMRLTGSNVTFNDLRSELQENGDGSSLLQLKNAANRFGVSSTIIKKKAFEYSDAQLPAIVFGDVSTSVVSEDESERLGHFVLLLQVDHENQLVTFMDGTSGKVTKNDSRERFERRFDSGFGMSRHATRANFLESVFAIVSLISFGTGLVFYSGRN